MLWELLGSGASARDKRQDLTSKEERQVGYLRVRYLRPLVRVCQAAKVTTMETKEASVSVTTYTSV